jgi:hypothetical protein
MSEVAEFLRARYEEVREKAKFIHEVGCDEVRHQGLSDCDCGQPQAILADCDAKLALVDDLLAERHQVVEDCWYTCPAATEERDGGETCNDADGGKPCNCGRDARVARRLGLLAMPYIGHPDYREAWKP